LAIEKKNALTSPVIGKKNLDTYGLQGPHQGLIPYKPWQTMNLSSSRTSGGTNLLIQTRLQARGALM